MSGYKLERKAGQGVKIEFLESYDVCIRLQERGHIFHPTTEGAPRKRLLGMDYGMTDVENTECRNWPEMQKLM